MADPGCNQKKELASTENSMFNCKTYTNVGIFTAVVLGVWVLFLVPVIMYNTRPADHENVSQKY